ncbi:MAG TPA: SDR family NAD(P)-dependent oxidoreductase [Longimicrobium sp.]|nr:SDR family NAD(P)-dependent oxidoreductase [Longimicrobium sp.]
MAEPRVALVTGGNRGIGLEICRGLIEAGLTVLLGARDEGRGAEAAARIGAVPIVLDVDDGVSSAAAVQRAVREHGRLDVLVNNAGVYPDEGVSALEVDPGVVLDTFRTNTVGPLRLLQLSVPAMRAAGYGRIVNVSSGIGAADSAGSGTTLAYALSKLALNALTQAAAAELQGTGVLVNAMCPGWVRTRMGGQAAPRSREQGAETAVWLATLEGDGPTGGFFRDRRLIAW